MDATQLFSAYPPPSDITERVLAAAERWIPSAVLAHSLRSWVLADLLAAKVGPCDREVLFTAAALHDIALTEPFDAHRAAFEVAGGAVAEVFAAGAGWTAIRARRVGEAIEAHMWGEVDPKTHLEGYLLEAATAADVTGRDLDRWDAPDLRRLVAILPRAEFSECFAAAVAEQASRKPESAARGLHDSGRIGRGDRAWNTVLAGDGE